MNIWIRITLIYLLIIAVGVVMLVSVWTSENRALSLIVGFGGMLIILFGLTMLSNLARAREIDKNPDYEKPVTEWTIVSKFLHYFSIAIAIITVYFCWGLLASQLENIVNGKKYLWNFIPISLMTAGSAIFIIYRLYPRYFINNEQRGTAIFALFMTIAFWTLIGFNLYNRETAKQNLRHEKKYIEEKSSNTMYGTPWVWFTFNGKRERFSPNQSEWKLLSENDSTILTIGKGELGYECIFGFTENYNVQRDYKWWTR
jgi:hypothetical protein